MFKFSSATRRASERAISTAELGGRRSRPAWPTPAVDRFDYRMVHRPPRHVCGPQQGANGPSVSLWQRPAPWTEVVAASCSQPSPTTRGEVQPQNAPQIQQKKDQLQRGRACQREGSTSEKICWVGPHTYGAHRAAQKPHSAPPERCAMLAGVVWEGLPSRRNRRNLTSQRPQAEPSRKWRTTGLR